MKEIDEEFTKFEKSLSNTLIIQFSTLRLMGVHGLHDHIMSMMDIELNSSLWKLPCRRASLSLHPMHPTPLIQPI